MTDRSPWIICPTCSGDGKHSQHLGSYTQSEFDGAFDPDEQDAVDLIEPYKWQVVK